MLANKSISPQPESIQHESSGMRSDQPDIQTEHLRLGNYEIRELLGSGGMARVYRGYDPALDRDVAIKMISTAGQPEDFVRRFQHEARVVAKLQHPNIVQIYQFGAQEQSVYMVQELLRGPTLARRLRELGKQRMPNDQVLSIMTQLAAALDYAHSHGVIHRDVKPGNVIYNTAGHLVLTDFGVASTPADPTKPQAGQILGTPGYIAPEQAAGSMALTHACDVYALGVVLFELLTGSLPFDDATPMGVMLRHLYDPPPPPSRLRTELPPAVDRVVLQALHKEPEARFPSAGALAQALRYALTPPQPAPRPARPNAVAPQRVGTSASRPASRRAQRVVARKRRWPRILTLLLLDSMLGGLLFWVYPNALDISWAMTRYLLGW